MTNRCNVPKCRNPLTIDGWSFCRECMVNTVRRLLAAEGLYELGDNSADTPPSDQAVRRAAEVVRLICANWQDLLREEQDQRIMRRKVL